MKNKKMALLYGLIFVLMISCSLPKQEKLEEFAAQKDYGKLFSYIEEVNEIITNESGSWRKNYSKHQERYKYAVNTLVGTENTAMLKNIENMFFGIPVKYDIVKQNILQVYNEQNQTFENLEPLCKEYAKLLNDNHITTHYDSMLAHIHDPRTLQYIYDNRIKLGYTSTRFGGGVNTFEMERKILLSFPATFKYPEVQKLKHEIELYILESGTISPLENEIKELNKIKAESDYTAINGYVVKQTSLGVYEIILPYTQEHCFLQTTSTVFTSDGYFYDLPVRFVKKVPVRTVGGFVNSWRLLEEVSEYDKNMSSSTISSLKDANKELKNAKSKARTIKRKIAVQNK